MSTLFPKKLDVKYTLYEEEHKHTLSRAKQEAAYLEASMLNQKANMSANSESFKTSFAEVLRISKKLNDASMFKYMKNTDSIYFKRTVKMW